MKINKKFSKSCITFLNGKPKNSHGGIKTRLFFVSELKTSIVYFMTVQMTVVSAGKDKYTEQAREREEK